MDNQILCPHCNKAIAITEALAHQMQEQLKAEREKASKQLEQEKENSRKQMGQEREKYREQLEEDKKKLHIQAEQWRDEERKRLEDKYVQTQKQVEQQLKEKIQREMDLKIKDTENESEELKKEKQQLQQQMLDTSKLVRQMRSELEQKNLEVERKLAEGQDKIRFDAQKRADEEYQLKMLEKDKKINDAMKMVEDYKRKLEQGSQQTQGEVLELQIEEMLRREFPLDDIKEVPKGKFGADLIQTVRSRSGEVCGTIVWELKRTKVWNNEWVQKLKNDQREIKAEVAVIISEVLPPEFKVFGNREGIWVGNYPSVLGLAVLLRKSLVDVSLAKSSSIGKKEKMEIMWEYLTSVEFKQRVEAIIEVFSAMQGDIEKEKIWFKKKWEKQESSIRRVIDNTAGMYGNLESIMGKALPSVKGLDDMEEDEPANVKLLKQDNSTLF